MADIRSLQITKAKLAEEAGTLHAPSGPEEFVRKTTGEVRIKLISTFLCAVTCAVLLFDGLTKPATHGETRLFVAMVLVSFLLVFVFVFGVVALTYLASSEQFFIKRWRYLQKSVYAEAFAKIKEAENVLEENCHRMARQEYDQKITQLHQVFGRVWTEAHMALGLVVDTSQADQQASDLLKSAEGLTRELDIALQELNA